MYQEKIDLITSQVLEVHCDERKQPSDSIPDLKIKPYFEFSKYRNNRGEDEVIIDMIGGYDLENDEVLSDLTPFVSVYAYDRRNQRYLFIANSENIGDILNNPYIDEELIAVFLDTMHEDFPHNKYPGLPKTSCIEYDPELRNLGLVIPPLSPSV